MKGNGVFFNSANSSSIQQVDHIQKVYNTHSIPMTDTSNSVTKVYQNGKLTQERYYDNNGNAYLDIDYSNHGNAKTHPDVPHQHHIKWINGNPRREKGEKVE